MGIWGGLSSAFRVFLRVAMFAGALGYLVVMIASHHAAFSPALEPVLLLGGFVMLVIPVVQLMVAYRGYWDDVQRALRMAAWSELRGRWRLVVYGLPVVAILVAAEVAGSSGNIEMSCASANSSAANCLKLDNWAERHGGYFRQYPYDAQGNLDPDAPWVAISRGEYVAEVGTNLRSAGSFGVIALGVGILVSLLEETAVSPSVRRFLDV